MVGGRNAAMVTRRKLTITMVALVLAVLAALLIVFWDYDLETTRRSMLATAHPCPADTTEKIERAGEVGWLRLCVRGDTRHGPFTYWKNQRKYAEGAYVNGKRTNVSYLDETGKVVRVEEPK